MFNELLAIKSQNWLRIISRMSWRPWARRLRTTRLWLTTRAKNLLEPPSKVIRIPLTWQESTKRLQLYESRCCRVLSILERTKEMPARKSQRRKNKANRSHVTTANQSLTKKASPSPAIKANPNQTKEVRAPFQVKSPNLKKASKINKSGWQVSLVTIWSRRGRRRGSIRKICPVSWPHRGKRCPSGNNKSRRGHQWIIWMPWLIKLKCRIWHKSAQSHFLQRRRGCWLKQSEHH